MSKKDRKAGVGVGAAPPSPSALRRWQEKVKKALATTPDVLRRAREMSRQQHKGNQGGGSNVGDRLARASTAASR